MAAEDWRRPIDAPHRALGPLPLLARFFSGQLPEMTLRPWSGALPSDSAGPFSGLQTQANMAERCGVMRRSPHGRWQELDISKLV